MALSEPGIFNVLDPWYMGLGMVAGNVTYAVAQRNAQVLQAAIYAAQQASSSGCGSSPSGFALAATVLIPGNNVVPPPAGGNGSQYFLAPATDGSPAVTISCYWPVTICGTGTVRLTMMANPLTGNAGDMFSVESNSGGTDADIGGIVFRDLQLAYPAITVTNTYAGIHVQFPGGQNVRILRVVFEDCPMAVWFQKSLQGSIFECTGTYTHNTGTMVQLGGNADGKDHAIETYIAACVFRSSNGGTGMSIQGSEHTRVMNVRLDGFFQGIEIVPAVAGPNAIKHSFENVTVYAGPPAGDTGTDVGTALLIEPQGGGAIGDIVFIGCEFQPGDGATSSGPAGVTINPGQGLIDTVRFVSCEVTRWFGNGVEIDGGSNIEILGGLYSGCAAASGTAAGIAILGSAIGVRVAGAACIGSYTAVTISSSAVTQVQQVGIYIKAASTYVRIIGCDLSGNAKYGAYVDGGPDGVEILSCNLNNNGTYGVFVTGESTTVTKDVFIRDCDASSFSSYNNAIHVVGTYVTQISNIQVTNCAGYNDSATALSSTLPTSGITFHNYDFSYYGPIAFMLWGSGVTHVHINGVSTSLMTGYFTLSPGERATIDYSGSPNFQVFAK